MLIQYGLHLLRRDVASTANDDLLFFAGKPVETVRILAPQIPVRNQSP
jgi:hypothetical protein